MSHFGADVCKGCHQDKEQKTYNVVMRLCDDCAQEEQCIQQLARENRVMFNCMTHPKAEALGFCRKHEETICLKCQPAHATRCCSLIDLNAEVADRRRQLSNLVEQCKLKMEELKQFNIDVDMRRHRIDNHFVQIKNEIHNVTTQEKREVEENRDLEAEFINRTAEEEFERIRQQQYEGLTRNQREAEKKIDSINIKEKGLFERIDQIQAMFIKKTLMMKSDLQQTLNNVEKAESCHDNEMLQHDFKKTEASLISGLSKQVDTCIIDKIVEEAESVGFDGDKRIDVPAETWEEQVGLTWTTRLGKESYMLGAINKAEVLLKSKDDGSVHILKVNSGETRMVISGKKPYDVYSCATLHDGRVVCGTRFDEIVVYDSSWKPLRVIHLDDSGKSVKLKPVSVCIDRVGQVLASNGKSTIHVFNPNNGEFIKSMDVNARSICEIHLLSEDIALRIRSVDEECTDVRILDNMGCLRSIHHMHNKSLMSMATNVSHGQIFMMLLDHDDDSEEFDMTALSSTGVAEIDIELPFDSVTLAEMCFMPETNALVVHYDGTTTVFQKTKPGLEEIISNLG